MYVFYRDKAEELKREFNERAAEAYASGRTMTNAGKTIKENRRTTTKIDTMMLSTLHEDVFKELIDTNNITIPTKAIAPYKDQVSDCISEETTVYYTLRD